jgi:RNA recognition motif-containing protein
MEENPTYASELSEKEAEMEERIVFINNLPIDTTQEEVDQIYSRCGPLDSIQLFNLRPDLDPGPLNKKQLEERKRKQRLSNPDTYATYQQQSRQRPRTPVYGILTFQTTEGFNIATGPEMSLFGCVIRRHPVMSIKPSAMKTLYLENIPQNLLSIELEYKLARLLHPHQMHVMQDGMRGVSNGGHQFSVSIDHEEYSEPSSCEVKFEDFHTANAAYQWMKGESSTGDKPYATFMNCDDCEVHWFRTPADKMKYWTRELNF